ncbi:SGNH/GDSL hydrolase family protein [Microbacterium sp. G2-8]|uniref:SGNH/GDSL hydrolase family protein n=1 Tax=Microbacterium sp. G2-8 TaxID=2842454 RepID=UPI001C89550F|nr:SGNH/GDSL hydrolase family protein [Microbacterium sp. G2-8]
MPRRIRRALACLGIVVLGSGALGACATESHGIDVSGDWPIVAAPHGTASAGPSMLILGDSWTNGMVASTPEHGYANRAGAMLDWETTVDGENGSGYLKAGARGGTFGTRALQLDPELAPDVIVIQGSINDRGEDLTRLTPVARSVWRAVEAKYPDAQLIVLGPAPSILPVSQRTERIDTLLGVAAAAEGVDYISPIEEGWITRANYDDIIDSSTRGAHHPSDDGHAYLAEMLVDDLGALVPGGGTEASGGMADGE